MKYPLFIFIGALALASCHNESVVSQKYFDIDSLINQQLVYLNKSGATLTKMASIDGSSDTTTLRPDSITWANELEVFRQLDLINKPVYTGAYEIEEGVKDVNSNLLVKSFKAKKSAPIRSLKLFYQSNPEKLRKVEAQLIEQNSLYFTTRKFLIELDDVNGKLILSKTRIKGVQKMILRDSVNFAIFSQFNY